MDFIKTDDLFLLKKELKRKVFHALILLFPFAYIKMSKETMMIVVSIVTFITIYLDVMRNFNSTVKKYINNILAPVMRDSEAKNFQISGTSYMALGLFVSGLFFSKEEAIASWIIVAVADSLSSIAGRFRDFRAQERLDKLELDIQTKESSSSFELDSKMFNKLLSKENIIIRHKTTAGSVTFFIISYVLTIVINNYFHLFNGFTNILLACIITTLVEYFSFVKIGKYFRFDDNFTIPVTYAFLASIL
jgi:dolichol kinase